MTLVRLRVFRLVAGSFVYQYTTILPELYLAQLPNVLGLSIGDLVHRRDEFVWWTHGSCSTVNFEIIKETDPRVAGLVQQAEEAEAEE